MSACGKVALVHDFLRDYGDAERVLEVLHQLYPDAPVYTAFIDYRELGQAADRFAGWDLRPTLAQSLPGITQHYHTLRLLIPYVWESLNLSEFDLVISSSGSYLSKSVLTRSQTLHVSYCHTPPRYLWEYHSLSSSGADNSWYRAWVNTQLRQYDFYASQRIDRFVTNSQTVAHRIAKFYRRTAEVIPPPVQIRGEGEAGDQYYLYVGTLTPDQQVDRVIQACNQLDRKLWIVGTGSDQERLARSAGSGIRFLGEVAPAEMIQIYANARALLYPCSEADFAFAPIEAMGHGVPVIASALSGLREVILDYRTGLLFQQPTVASLQAAILEFESLRFFSQACIQRAEEFAQAVFTSKLEWFIAQALDEHQAQGPMFKG